MSEQPHATAGPAAVATEPKPDLFDQILVVGGYVDRFEMSKKIEAEKGCTLGVAMENDLRCLRQTLKTLELLRVYEKEFVDLVTKARAKAKKETGGHSAH